MASPLVIIPTGSLQKVGDPPLPWLPAPKAAQEQMIGLLARQGCCRPGFFPPPTLALLTMSQDVISGQEGFSRDRFPVLRPWFQAHVDPLAGSPAVKLLIVKYLEEMGRGLEEAAVP